VSDDEKVVCGRHGETPVTYACRHVASGVACGFHAEAVDGDEWPDAWCDSCDELLASVGGEWTDETSERADIKLLCTHCYEQARERNRVVPPLARGARARLTPEEQDRLFHHATHVGQSKQEEAKRRWLFGEHAKWYYDNDARTLSFSDPVLAPAIVNVTLVGSYSTRSATFQWSWELYDRDDPAIGRIAELQAFGEVRGIEALATACWDAEQVDAWEMASLAGYLLGCDGMYRVPFEEDDLYWFMLLQSWRHPS